MGVERDKQKVIHKASHRQTKRQTEAETVRSHADQLRYDIRANGAEQHH